MKIASFLNKENNNLDLVRIILACAVIAGHSIFLNGDTKYWIDPIKFVFPVTYSGALAVKIFFFISGLVVANSYIKKESFLYFIIARIFRILPALLFLLLITVFIVGPIFTNISVSAYFLDMKNISYITDNMIFRTNYTLTEVFYKNYYKNAINGSLWSLHYEIRCYFFLMCLFLLFKNIRLIVFNIVFFVILIDNVLPSGIILSKLDSNPEIYYLPISFAYGVFMAINQNKIVINFRIVSISFIIYYIVKDVKFSELFLILAFCNLIIFVSSRKWFLKLRPKYDISYGVYLWGFLIQQIIYAIVGRIYTGLHFLTATLISILIAYISFILIEKPCILLGKRVFLFCEINNEKLKNLNFK